MSYDDICARCGHYKARHDHNGGPCGSDTYLIPVFRIHYCDCPGFVPTEENA